MGKFGLAVLLGSFRGLGNLPRGLGGLRSPQEEAFDTRTPSPPNASAAISASTGSINRSKVSQNCSTMESRLLESWVRNGTCGQLRILKRQASFCRVVFEGVHRRWPDCGQSAYDGRPVSR